jgi:outer membrane protein
MNFRCKESLIAFRLLFCTLICSFVIPLKAQQNKILKLDEAIKLANKNSLQLKADSIDIEKLNTKVVQSHKDILPDIGLNLGYRRISDNIIPYKVGFPTGEVVLNPQILNQSFNSLQISQLIWSGGKLKVVNEIAKKEVEAATFDLAKNKLNTANNITILWYNLYILKTAKKVLEANVTILKESKKDISNFVKQGLVLENEVLKIDLAIINFESNLMEMNNSINALNYNIALTTGLELNTVFELPELEESKLMVQNNLQSYIDAALENRVELKTISKYQEIADLGLKLAKLNTMPTISAIASGNLNLPEQRQFPNKNTFTPTWYAGVNFNWALSSFYKNPIKIKESRQAIEKTKILFKQAEQGIMMEVNAAYTEYLQAVQKIRVSNKTIELATENFRVEQNKLKASTITTTEFLDANIKLVQAKLNLSAATANAELALIKLNKTANK